MQAGLPCESLLLQNVKPCRLGCPVTGIEGKKGTWCWAVLFGVAGATTLRFWEVEPAAGLLLLPFLAYSAFGTLLLNLSLDSNSAEVGWPAPVEARAWHCPSLCDAGAPRAMPVRWALVTQTAPLAGHRSGAVCWVQEEGDVEGLQGCMGLFVQLD